MVDDAEFSDEEMAKLGLSLDDDSKKSGPSVALDENKAKKRAPPPESAFVPKEPNPFDEPAPEKKAPDAAKLKVLAQKSHKESTGGGMGATIFKLVLLGGLVGGGLFGWTKFQQARIQAEFDRVAKDFSEEVLAVAGDSGSVDAGMIRDAVQKIAAQKNFVITRDEITAYSEEITLNFKNEGGKDVCEAEADPEVWDEMTKEEQKQFDAKTAGCQARYLVGFQVERLVKVGPIKMTARGHAYLVAKDYSDSDDHGS